MNKFLWTMKRSRSVKEKGRGSLAFDMAESHAIAARAAVSHATSRSTGGFAEPLLNLSSKPIEAPSKGKHESSKPWSSSG
jgi:hypothetical protein